MQVIEYADGAGAAYTGKLLADAGATVIKVEAPRRGSTLRNAGPGHVEGVGSGLFQLLCNNKQSVTLNLETWTGRALFRDLLMDSDLLVADWALESDSGGELDFDSLRSQVSVVSVTGEGAGGSRDTTDLVTFNTGGLGYLTPPGSDRPDQPPLRSGGGPQSELQAGLNAAVAALAILRAGRSQQYWPHVDVSAQEAAILCQEGSVPQYTYNGVVASRLNQTALWSRFNTRTGLFYIHKFDEKWPVIRAMIIEMSEAPLDADDLVLSVSPPRDVVALFARLQTWFAEQDAQVLYHYLQARGVACAPSASVVTGFQSEHLKARGFWQTLELNGEPVQVPVSPLRMSATPARSPSQAPRLGASTDDIVGARLGYTEEECAQMRAAGII